ncbi:MAG: RidA family protein, partial [Acidobacteriaceae bacterium]|nr:RidA family protein [Acidobacteriaceae bacterium]
MPRQLLFAFLLCAAALLAGASVLLGQRKKSEEPKTQVLPLPPELPMALAADTETLDFHISPLLKTGGLSAQIHQSLYELIRDTRGETIIKLRAFVAGAGDARRVQAIVGDIFTERKLSLPVLSIIQVGALGEEAAQVVIEAVVSTHRKVNPGGLAFLAGQTGDSFQQALHRLTESAAAASVSGNRVLTCTCFTSRIDNFESLREAVRAEFPNSGINVVQALR